MALTASAYLEHLIDYAGTFPPAALPLEGAVAEYRRLRGAGAEWMVGPLLVRSLDVVAAGELLGDDEVDLAVALVSGDLAADLELVRLRLPTMRLVQLEARLPIDPEVVRAGCSWDGLVALYAELAGSGALAAQVSEVPPLAEALVGVADVRVKVRTGGPTADAVPSSVDLAEFLVACHEAGLSFKATAGLHAPYRHHDELTGGDQHGFLNVLAASALAVRNVHAQQLVDVLEARSPEALSAAWGQAGGDGDPGAARQFFRSFGSCSAAEPIEHLEHFGLLSTTGTPSTERLW